MLQSKGLQRVQHNRVPEQHKVTWHVLSTQYILAILERRSETGMSLRAKENFLVKKKKKNPDLNNTNWARCNLIRINKHKVLGLPWWYSG